MVAEACYPSNDRSPPRILGPVPHLQLEAELGVLRASLLFGVGDVVVHPHMALPIHQRTTLLWVNPLPLAPGFDPGLVLHLIESERGTIFADVPTMLLALLDHPDFSGRGPSSVRLAGGATVPPPLVRRVESTLDVPFTIIQAGC